MTGICQMELVLYELPPEVNGVIAVVPFIVPSLT